MRTIGARLVSRIRRTPTIESFRFIPEEKVRFEPGQFLQLLFNEGDSGDRELNKYLSLSCSPYREYIEVTKRLSDSPFSARLKALTPGSRVLVKMPFGSCIFKQDYPKVAFFIGGIGITPVISIIEYISDTKLDTQVKLLYSNRTDEEIAFRSELEAWRSSNSRLRALYIVTDCQPRDPACIHGVIDGDLILANVEDLKERVCFVFGPPRMVEEMSRICRELGVDPQNIKTEGFVGY